MKSPVIEVHGNWNGIFKFNEQLGNLYKNENAKEIYIDARKCDFINSYTLGTVIYYYSLMMKQNRKIVWVLSKDKNNYMNRLFEMTGLEKLFDVVRDLEDGSGAGEET